MKVSEQIIEVLDYLCQKIGVVVDWTAENVMLALTTLTEKYISYELVMSSLQCGEAILLIIASIIWLIVWLKHPKWLIYEERGTICTDVRTFIMVGVFIVLLGVGFSICLSEIPDIVKCLTFPELKLYEYITDTVLPEIDSLK